MAIQQPFCLLPFEKVKVTSEGDVAMCQYQQNFGTLGNLLERPFEDLWFGETAGKIRETTLGGKLHEKCRTSGCPHVRERLEPGAWGKVGLPVFLEIDLPNSHCNVGGHRPSEKNPACIMCERSSRGYRFQDDRLSEILPRLRMLMPTLKGLRIHGIAEPFWHDYVFGVLDQLGFGEFKDRIRVSMHTNGTLLDAARRSRFLDRCPNSEIWFSLDAGSAETYRKIRRLDIYDRVVENLMGYARDRKAYANAGLVIHNNINLLNVDEVVEMVRVAARAKVNMLVFNPTAGIARKILVSEKNAPRFKKAQQLIEAEAARLAVPLRFAWPLDRPWAPVEPGMKSIVSNVIIGMVDGLRDGKLLGWVWNPSQPERKLTVEVLSEGEVIASGPASRFREDLLRAGFGDGCHSFEIDLPEGFSIDGPALVARVKELDFELNNSLYTIPVAAAVD